SRGRTRRLLRSPSSVLRSRREPLRWASSCVSRWVSRCPNRSSGCHRWFLRLPVVWLWAASKRLRLKSYEAHARETMGWTDLFKSKSAKLKPDGALRWFGKLSTCRDYFNSKVDEEWAAEFNDWVMKGYERYHAQGAAHPASSTNPESATPNDGS